MAQKNQGVRFVRIRGKIVPIKIKSFEEWHKKSKKISSEVDQASAVLQKFNKLRNSVGLIPDEVKATSEYRSAKLAYDTAFQKQRAHNSYSKEYLKKASALRRASWKK